MKVLYITDFIVLTCNKVTYTHISALLHKYMLGNCSLSKCNYHCMELLCRLSRILNFGEQGSMMRMIYLIFKLASFFSNSKYAVLIVQIGVLIWSFVVIIRLIGLHLCRLAVISSYLICAQALYCQSSCFTSF